LPDIEDICEDKTLNEEEKEERHRNGFDDAEKTEGINRKYFNHTKNDWRIRTTL